MPQTRFKISHAQIIQETFDDEVVIVDLSQGTYFSLSGAGSAIWNAALQGESENKIIARLHERTGSNASEIESTTQQFLQLLQDENLLVTAENEYSNTSENEDTNDSTTHSSSQRHVFIAPQLQKFSDMQALLMLDPIHEVDEAGWPNVKAIAEKTPAV